MNAHIDSQLAFGESAARGLPSSPPGNAAVLPTVVVISKRRIARPSAMAESTDPPSESSTSVALRMSLAAANCSNSRTVDSVMAPMAEIQTRQLAPQSAAGPSMRHSKRIGAGLPSLLAAGRSAANAARQPHTSAQAPTRYRITLSPLSLPAQASRAQIFQAPATFASLFEARDGPQVRNFVRGESRLVQ